jgi:hypothetical protein
MSSFSLDRAIELADSAVDRRPGSALVAELGRRPSALAPTAHPYGALVGLTCPATVQAVASTYEVDVRVRSQTNRCRRDGRIGVAVTRSGGSVARFRSADRGELLTLGQLDGPLVDIGHRALGLSTPPCNRTPLALVDAAFVDGVLRSLLEADLGTPRPSWFDLSARHPLAGSITITPAALLDRRRALAGLTWSGVRQGIIEHGETPHREMTPALAGWLDDGSFGRWLFAPYPEPDQAFADVCELLDAPTSAALRESLAPVLPSRLRDRP